MTDYTTGFYDARNGRAPTADNMEYETGYRAGKDSLLPKKSIYDLAARTPLEAAAPDLLAALKEIAAGMDSFHPAALIARAAIAKAEGEK